jgi:hypothetical protein
MRKYIVRKVKTAVRKTFQNREYSELFQSSGNASGPNKRRAMRTGHFR